jgi:hypothetical protein
MSIRHFGLLVVESTALPDTLREIVSNPIAFPL